MTVVAFIIVPLVLLGAAAVVWWMHRSNVVSSRFREQVVATTKAGDSFAGILFEADRRALVLRQSVAVGAGENRTDLPLDGELILLLADIAFIQRP